MLNYLRCYFDMTLLQFIEILSASSLSILLAIFSKLRKYQSPRLLPSNWRGIQEIVIIQEDAPAPLRTAVHVAYDILIQYIFVLLFYDD